jgi:hypothetical protein
MTFGRGNIMPGNVKTIEDGLLNPYHKEQIDALTMVTRHLDNLPASEQQTLTASLAEYLIFRREVDEYLTKHFSETCTHTCYHSRLSACC